MGQTLKEFPILVSKRERNEKCNSQWNEKQKTVEPNIFIGSYPIESQEMLG